MRRGYYIHARKMVDWHLRKNPYAYSIWNYLLEMASGTERNAYFNGKQITLKPGQLVTGRIKISDSTGIPQTTVERWLKKFEKMEQIGQQKTNKSRLITIVNWGDYQFNGQQTDNKWTTNGQQTDTSREGREGKITNTGKQSGQFKKPTVEEIAQYCDERKNSLDPKKIFDHYEATNWFRGKAKISNWKACVRTWERNKSNTPDWK